ncbi:exopolysaccharide biosynthesis polyprenyl glycosylphosphotransferase [Prosthecobacter sp.]|uniref:exopolysaccharide biosynthesis polyprenyl glycosylphosphotransferase n=1 Tax=Prosthecobacter sp. TaxID=1965333 RepID=UPI003784D878
MHSSSRGHWTKIGIRTLRDVVVFIGAYLLANYVRFTELWRIEDYVPPILAGAVALSSSVYVLGLYSVESQRRSSFLIHGILLTFAFVIAFVSITLVGYMSFDLRIGRGFMALGCLFSYPLLLTTHWLMYHKHRLAPERVAMVAETPEELKEYQLMRSMTPPGVQLVGRIGIDDDAENEEGFLGRLRNARKLIRTHKLDRIVFMEQRVLDEKARHELRRLRYLGFSCSSLISVCERHLNYVPLHLVSMNWLIQSESVSRSFYFSKLKRFFDITTSLILLVVLAPFFLLGMAIVRIFSPEGSVFYRQERVGRFGKRFQIIKLRSMRTDAEKSGPVWSSVSADSRVFPGGAFLRRYRIDEIPQLLNVLRGEMSFVGPRPERPEFVARLTRMLPHYQERHMLQPGLTGWAQVCYPYGSSINDSKCKLEYDLYYLKHAGVLFDSLILLDTVRVVLGGGLKSPTQQRYTTGVDLDGLESETVLVPETLEQSSAKSSSIQGLAQA